MTEDVTLLVDDSIDSQPDRDLFQHAGRFYRVSTLNALGAGTQRVVGAALLASEERHPNACPIEISRAVGHHMQRARNHEQSASETG